MSTRLRCLLLDDELPGLTYLKMLCEQIPGLDVVKAFDNPVVFLDELHSLEFDLCILDIEMPEINGMQIANLLGGKPVIFTTAYKEFAADAFELNAVDYLVKPIRKERLQEAVMKAATRIHLPHDYKPFIQWNSNKGKALIYMDQIGYIRVSETDSRDKLVYLTDGSLIYLKNITFEKMLQWLPAERFCRINKKEIIALRIIKVFSYDEISTSLHIEGTELKVTLGESYRQDFLQKIRR